MSKSNNYTVYLCSTCGRKTEIQVDSRRPDPVRCNITFACQGVLSKINKKSSRDFLFTPVISGLQDYIPRNTKVSTLTTENIPLKINMLSASTLPALTLACPFEITDSSGTSTFVNDASGQPFKLATRSSGSFPLELKLQLKLAEITPSSLTFIRYTFIRSTGTQVIQGADDSIEKKNLRLTSASKLKIFVNGVELLSSQYDKTISDQISFTPQLVEINNVIDVLVLQDLSLVSNRSISLNFNQLVPTINVDRDARQKLAWGDQTKVIIDGTTKFLCFCTDLSNLTINSNYVVIGLSATSSLNDETRDVLLSSADILLSADPHAFIDKELHARVNISNLVSTESVLNYQSVITGETNSLTIPQSSITQSFNPIYTSEALDITSSNLVGSTNDLNGTEDLIHKFILGPS